MQNLSLQKGDTRATLLVVVIHTRARSGQRRLLAHEKTRGRLGRSLLQQAPNEKTLRKSPYDARHEHRAPEHVQRALQNYTKNVTKIEDKSRAKLSTPITRETSGGRANVATGRAESQNSARMISMCRRHFWNFNFPTHIYSTADATTQPITVAHHSHTTPYAMDLRTLCYTYYHL